MPESAMGGLRYLLNWFQSHLILLHVPRKYKFDRLVKVARKLDKDSCDDLKGQQERRQIKKRAIKNWKEAIKERMIYDNFLTHNANK